MSLKRLARKLLKSRKRFMEETAILIEAKTEEVEVVQKVPIDSKTLTNEMKETEAPAITEVGKGDMRVETDLRPDTKAETDTIETILQNGHKNVKNLTLIRKKVSFKTK